MYVVMVRTGEQGMYLTNQLACVARVSNQVIAESYSKSIRNRREDWCRNACYTGYKSTAIFRGHPLQYIPAKFLLHFFSLQLTSLF